MMVAVKTELWTELESWIQWLACLTTSGVAENDCTEHYCQVAVGLCYKCTSYKQVSVVVGYFGFLESLNDLTMIIVFVWLIVFICVHMIDGVHLCSYDWKCSLAFIWLWMFCCWMQKSRMTHQQLIPILIHRGLFSFDLKKTSNLVSWSL